jgi:hypothetical protein
VLEQTGHDDARRDRETLAQPPGVLGDLQMRCFSERRCVASQRDTAATRTPCMLADREDA